MIDISGRRSQPGLSPIARRRSLLALPPLLTALAARAARAQGATVHAGAQTHDEGHPFAEHRLALQLSDGEPAKQKLVLSVANNMLKQFTPDLIDIEVVTFGPGIVLLYADSPFRERVDSLVAQGVRFDVCMNTVNAIRDSTGRMPALSPQAHPVTAGVGQLLLLSERKYAVIRP